MAEPTDPQKAILFEKRGNVAIISISVPHKLNAVTQPCYFRIASLLAEIAEMDDVVFTVVRGLGRFWSAYVPAPLSPGPPPPHHANPPPPSGADVTISRTNTDIDANPRAHWVQGFVAGNMHNTHQWYTHPKILIVALNGPAVGMSAALTAHADFVYAAPHAWLLTPFTSLGLVAEGASSRAFVDRLGISKANEALLMSKKITMPDLLATGYVNKVLEAGGGDPASGKGIDDEKFLAAVLGEIEANLGSHLNHYSMINMKKLIRKPGRALMVQTGVDEVFGGLDVFMKGIPQKEFAKIASGEKRHKL